MANALAILRKYKAVIASLGTPVTVTWREAAGGTWNPPRQIWDGETVADQSATVDCQFSDVGVTASKLRHLGESKVEHVLFDFAGDALGGVLSPQGGESLVDVPLIATANRRITDVRFTLGGRAYVPSETGRNASDSFNDLIQGVLISKSVLCVRAK